jgi:hypothetical protein
MVLTQNANRRIETIPMREHTSAAVARPVTEKRLSTRLIAIEVEQKFAAQAREAQLTSLSALSAQVAILTRQVAQLEGRMAGQQK